MKSETNSTIHKVAEYSDGKKRKKGPGINFNRKKALVSEPSRPSLALTTSPFGLHFRMHSRVLLINTPPKAQFPSFSTPFQEVCRARVDTVFGDAVLARISFSAEKSGFKTVDTKKLCRVSSGYVLCT